VTIAEAVTWSKQKFVAILLFLEKGIQQILGVLLLKVAEAHHFYAAQAPCETFDAAPACSGYGSGSYPTVLYINAKFKKRTKV
jgi:hypothetical protein